MASLFPPIEPYDRGMLDVGDGQQIYWECCGNPEGRPALCLHGGPGTGATAGMRRFFDPEAYKIIVFDQRGSGRSRPLASAPDADLRTNTTAHLIADIEVLRERHGGERWRTILGLSWGTTLGLAYAQAHPQRVESLVLGFVMTASRRYVAWVTGHDGVGQIFPQQWERFAAAVPDRLRHLPLADAYAALLFDPDPAVRDRAARAWCTWEDAHIALTPGHRPSPRYEDPEYRLRFARLVTHYWRHFAFLDEDGEDTLLRDAARLNGIPGVLVNGRFDISGHPETAWHLSRRWATSELHVLDDVGHGGGDAARDTLISALRGHFTILNSLRDSASVRA